MLKYQRQDTGNYPASGAPGIILRLSAGILLATGLMLAAALTGSAAEAEQAGDPLPTWKDGAAKQAILDFIRVTTDQASPDFVTPAQRIVTFDNDGTLWVEHPIYTQLAFALDRVKALAPQHPEWKDEQPFKAVLDNDFQALAAAGEKGLIELVMASHAGMSTEEFEAIVMDWMAKAKDPRFKRSYPELAYQPMVELLGYLRAKGFKTYIVSGGGVEFMRPITQRLYGIPPEQVIGSSIKTQYEFKDGKPELMRLPEIDFIDDKAGKPVGINQYIGRRPIAAFGNSDGDRQMLEWTGAGSGARLMVLVLHDDAEREYAYGPANELPNTKFGTFPDSLMKEANKKGWIVISMKNDWVRVFSFEQ
jgi:phosphoglycolate phosphatase-like HAD superfamily hydrolase